MEEGSNAATEEAEDMLWRWKFPTRSDAGEWLPSEP